MATHVVSQLSKEYARLKGRYEVIDREIEYVVGVQQILAEIDRIEGIKRQMQARLDQIIAIVGQLDPAWKPQRVRPIYPRDRKAGVLSRIVYQILRQANAPLKSREIARIAAARLNIDPIQRELVRLENAVANALKLRVGKSIMIVSEKPIRWAVMPRDQIIAALQCASQSAPVRQETAVAPRPMVPHSDIPRRRSRNNVLFRLCCLSGGAARDDSRCRQERGDDPEFQRS